jgi:hypothetical protein
VKRGNEPGAVEERNIMKQTKKRMTKVGQVLNAWETLAADQTLAGLTLAQFKAAIQPALDASGKVTSLTTERLDTRKTLDDSATSAHDTALLIVNGVKVHPEHGEDSPLYAAMGYVRKSDRKSGLSRKSSKAGVATAKAAA